MNVSLQATRIELAQFILSSNNALLIRKISSLVKSEKQDFWNELSADEKEEVKISRQQIERGETEDWSELRKRLSGD